MKALIILLSFLAFNVNAQGYLGVYGSNELSTKSTTNAEISNDNPLATIVIGSQFGNKFGATAEILFNGGGGGASAGLFAKTGNFTMSGGVISIPDSSKGSISGFSDAQSIKNARGLYLGIKYKIVSLRYIKYDVDHEYNASKVVGFSGTPPNHIPVYAFGSSSDSITREIIWIGAVLPF